MIDPDLNATEPVVHYQYVIIIRENDQSLDNTTVTAWRKIAKSQNLQNKSAAILSQD